MGALTLIYGSHRTTARAGQAIVFTAWITNESKRPLRNVHLIPGSFTNEGLANLAYTNQPGAQELWIGRLAAGDTVQRSFLYLVTVDDVRLGGELISGMGVQARSWFRRERDKQDATVSIVQNHPALSPLYRTDESCDEAHSRFRNMNAK
jgi:hypothetical protein